MKIVHRRGEGILVFLPGKFEFEVFQTLILRRDLEELETIKDRGLVNKFRSRFILSIRTSDDSDEYDHAVQTKSRKLAYLEEHPEMDGRMDEMCVLHVFLTTNKNESSLQGM